MHCEHLIPNCMTTCYEGSCYRTLLLILRFRGLLILATTRIYHKPTLTSKSLYEPIKYKGVYVKQEMEDH